MSPIDTGVPAPGDPVAIVILNWNGRDDTLRCLDSLKAHTSEATIVVVDNGSTDDSVSAIHEAHPELEVIEAGDNLGYAGGNNLGIVWALDRGFEIVGVLNNDTVVEPGWLEPLIAEITRDPANAVTAPIIRYLDGEDIWFAGSRFDEHRGFYVHATVTIAPQATLETPALTGCALFAHRNLWERVGLFDESFFLIFEDADWSQRVADAGGRQLVVAGSNIRHAVSASFVASASGVGTYYFARNGLRHLRRVGRSRAQQRNFASFCIREASRAVRHSPSKGLKPLSTAARGLIDGWLDRGGRVDLARS